MPKLEPSEKVFISHAMADRQLAKEAIAVLREKGILGITADTIDPDHVFVPGSSLKGALREAMQSASKVVVIWSDAAAESPWVNYEAGMADALGKHIIIVVPAGGASRIPANLSHMQVVELRTDG